MGNIAYPKITTTIREPSAKSADAEYFFQPQFAVAFAVYLVAGCFYVFESGNPQPADFLMIVVVGLCAIVNYRYFFKSSSVITPVLIMCVYFAAVDGIHYILEPDARFLISSVYYFYNAIIFLFVISLCLISSEYIRRAVSFSTIVILALELAAVIVNFKLKGSRDTGTFNDPNQLGYMIILTLCCRIIVKNTRNVTLFDIICFAMGLFVILETKSRSATVGLLATVAVCLIFLKTTKYAKILLLFIALSIIPILIVQNIDVISLVTHNEHIQGLVQRFYEHGADDSFEGRGYYRIIDYPQYLLFGSGEGAYWRFGGNEIHSTWASILFCYGVIGISLFLWLLYAVYRHAPIFHVLLFAGPAGFGLATYGARFSMFWVMLGLVYGLAAAKDMPPTRRALRPRRRGPARQSRTAAANSDLCRRSKSFAHRRLV